MSLLVVDTADDAILAECESTQDLISILEQVEKERPQCEILVVSCAEHHGQLVSTQSLISMRAMSDAEGFSLWAG